MRMTQQPPRRFRIATGAQILIVMVFGSAPVYAQVKATPVAMATAEAPAPAVDPAPAVGVEPVDATTIRLLVGHSTLVNVGAPISRVSLTSADIADALVTSSNQLLVHGKVPGSISMFVWQRAGSVQRYEIAVQRDLSKLSDQVKELFPKETIQVHPNGRQVVLSGTVSTKDVADKAISVATGYVSAKDDVVTLLQVAPARASNQVLLRVRFAEVSRSAMTQVGASFFTSPTGVKNTVGRVTTQQYSAPNFSDLEWSKASGDFGAPVTSAGGKFNFSDFLNLFILSERYDLGMLIKALQNKGLFQSLAEPNLVAESGKEASFLAGGEFPVPIAQGGTNNAISVQYKEFGIRLNFTPTVNGDRVRLKVRPEVSTLDFGNAVVLQGFRIPALTTRRTETELELRSGQTFAIAGLVNNQMQSTLQKIPGIGDIPILGYLFKSKAAQKDQTELVVMITPEILPIDSEGVTGELPRMTESFMPPVPENLSRPAPAPAFTPQARTGALNVEPTAEERKAAALAQEEERARMAEEQRLQAEEARALAKQAKEDARLEKEEQARLDKLAREQAKRDREAAAQAARQAEIEKAQQEKLAREQAKRDAEDAKRQEALAKRAAEEAKRQQAEEAKRQQAIAAAEAKLKAAQQEYQEQLASRSGGK